MNIDEEFDRFIEFPSDSKTYVTSVSAKLFAKHCVKKLETAIRETIEYNLHLADGEICTLSKLKNAINYDQNNRQHKCRFAPSLFDGGGTEVCECGAWR